LLQVGRGHLGALGYKTRGTRTSFNAPSAAAGWTRPDATGRQQLESEGRGLDAGIGGENKEATYTLLLISAVVAGDKSKHTVSFLILNDARGGGHAIDLLLHIELVGIGVGVGVGVCDRPSDSASSHKGPVHSRG
jgi:hypothetical protein